MADQSDPPLSASPIVPGVAVVDVQGRVRMWNAAAEHLTGWPAGEIEGHPIPMACSDDAEDGRDALAAALAKPSGSNIPLALRGPQGETLSLRAWVSPVADSDCWTLVLVPTEPARAASDPTGVSPARGITVPVAELKARPRGESALVRERAQLQGILDAVSVGMLLVDESGAVRHVNNAVSRWIGRDLQAQYGEHPGDIMGCMHAVGNDQGCGHTAHCLACPLRNAIHSVLTTGLPVRGIEARLALAPDGAESALWLEINADLLLLEGRPHVLMALTNVTERKHMEETLRETLGRLKYHVENSPLAVVEFDAALRITRWAGAAEQVFGWTADEVLGCAMLDIPWVHPDDIASVETVRDAMLSGAPRTVNPNRNRRKDGAIIWCEWYNSALQDRSGEMVSVLSLVLDVTDRVKAQQALAAADRAKDEFLAMLSHELRNPLGAIGNAAALIGLQAEGHAFLRKPVDILNRQVKHTARLVDDLLDVSRITRGKMELRRETLDMVSVVRRAAEVSRAQMEVHGHEFSVSLPSAPLWLEGDAARLEQVIGNLLNNAAKYTESGGHIRVSLTRESGQAVLRVRDDGRGIAREMLGQIFDMFTQEDRSLARSEGGLGIGLTLVRKLVEMHGGEVEAESEGPGRGSEFRVRLPLRENGTEPDGQVPAAASAPCRRVLVVEDNVDAAEALASILSLWGHAVQTVHDGPTALKAAAQQTPDVVVLDIGLPVMDGYEVARALRQETKTAGSLLIALTGYGQESDGIRAREVGFDRHLVKPVDLDLLKGILDEAFADQDTR